MTLTRPKHRKLDLLIVISGLILLVVSLGNVFIYNKIVNLQHLLSNQEEKIQELRLANVETKDQLYKLLDTGNLAQFSQKEGLVKIRKPEYLEINDSISFYNTNN